MKIIRQIFNDIFGWNCPQCHAKRSVFFSDSYIWKGKYIEVYKCKVCEEEGDLTKN
jgi:transcription elongation factor Elf1